jgi:signal transduction histidine kinase
MTFSIAGSPFLLFIASTQKSSLPWEADAIQFVRSICSVLRAKSVSDRVKEADAIKTAFLSSISHELRTPMHGVMMGLEVLGRALAAGDQKDIKLSLAATESSGYTLQTILNDVLDFGKWTTMMDDESLPSPANLVEIATRAMMTCSAHYSSMGFNPEIVLEYADHDWTLPIVEARFHRYISLSSLSDSSLM